MIPPDSPDDQKLAHTLRRSRLLQDAPEALVQQAIALGAALRPARAQDVAAKTPMPLLQRLAASLSFDSAGQSLAAAGVRGQGDAMRQLLYSAGERDIDLRISVQPGGHWRVSGQVLGPDERGTATIDCAGHRAEAAWNDLAEFSFDGVPGGECSVTLRGADWELVLPALRLAADGTA